MKREVQKTLIPVISLVLICVAGCQEQEVSGTKKSRLIAAENIRLSKAIEERDRRIEKLEKLQQEQIERQEELLAECVTQKETLQKQLQQNIREQVDSVLAVVMEKNAELHSENESLKAQIEELKTKLAEDEGV